MPKKEITPICTEVTDMQTARKIEQDKLSRRQALRKFGFGAGFAALALLGVDDLARMVGKRIERMAGDEKVANQIAHEFREAGVAFASGSASAPPSCCPCFRQLNKDSNWCQSCRGKGCSSSACMSQANAAFVNCMNACGNRIPSTPCTASKPGNCGSYTVSSSVTKKYAQPCMTGGTLA